MVCDYIEKPYRAKARLFRDSDVEVDIHWYFARDTALTLPFPSPIKSLQWLNQLSPVPTLGQQIESDLWLEKPNRIPVPPAGDHFHGEREDFERGCVYDDVSPPLERGEDGIPLVCGGMVGGLVLSGWMIVTPPVPVLLSGGIWASVTTPIPAAITAGHPYWVTPANLVSSSVVLTRVGSPSAVLTAGWMGYPGCSVILIWKDGGGGVIGFAGPYTTDTWSAVEPVVSGWATVEVLINRPFPPGSLDPWQVYTEFVP